MRALLLLVLSSLLALPPVAPAARGPKRLKMAVTEIKPLGTDPTKATLLSEIALAEAAADARLEVIGSSDIAGMIGFEKQKQMLGCTEDTSCLTEIAGALGVDYVLQGSFGKLGAAFRIDITVLDVKRSRVFSRANETVSGSEELLITAVQRLVRKALEPIPSLAAPPAEAAKSEPARPPEAAIVAAPSAPEQPPVQVAATPEPEAPSVPGAWRRYAGIGAVAAGGAALAGGGVTAFLAWQTTNEQREASIGGDRARFDALKRQATKRALVADVLLISGAVLAGAGALLWFTAPDSPPPPVAIGVGAAPEGMMVVATGGF